MKSFILMAAMMTTISAYSATNAEKTYHFQFKSIKKAIVTKAINKDEAFKIAAKECFTQLTGGRYPGEEKGLDIIDICANPKM